MITAEGLVKRYGAKTAVNDISFTVRPGQVTGFLGPNGAGKSTTMRMIVGLDRPSEGRVTVNGKPYAAHRAPLHEVGALLDAKAVHTGRTAYNHLLAMGATHGIGASRVREVIEMTGLESVARKRVGGFSLGMGQRLGIAAAMLGDPSTLILDEPVNGLDPEGVLWVRQFVRHLASEGRTIFLSSHLMSEMALTADHLIVLGRGEIIADAPVADIIAGGTRPRVLVRSPHSSQLADLLAAPEVAVIRSEAGVLEVTGVAASGIGDLAAQHGLSIHELTPLSASLEEAYMALTADAVEYRTEAVR
ncbi:ABC-2 type transport system ATP-binding protein [Agromyces cerinus]|uniref:ABC-2 type transport system ATP-binding protein n=1 Tax=Agromyces hippuratus TaxID=286438 RepID=A0A852WQG0_9MICO|nr:MULTISPECIES: ATP-binding cassette domain-containing protein [Agromyces]MBM7830325.1 ABC-2 type transport system ATP-binding protein [Agromyces cerinus]NYG20239.1 ABC-2 type transport system ATP-binding protein [Agromyces hippuratus]